MILLVKEFRPASLDVYFRAPFRLMLECLVAGDEKVIAAMFRVLQRAAESPLICQVRGALIIDLLKDLRKAARNPRFSALLRDAGK